MLQNTTIAPHPRWTAVRTALVADVLRRQPASGQVVSLRVHGESMLPAIWPGDVVEIQSCSEDIRPGEIVLATRDGQLFLHRLLAPCRLDGFLLRGDSLPGADPLFPREALLGRLAGFADKKRSIPELALSPGFGARLSRAIGLLLCHCRLARRVALKLHSRRKALPCEFGNAVPSPAYHPASLVSGGRQAL
jgi:Peptidase S24-like